MVIYTERVYSFLNEIHLNCHIKYHSRKKLNYWMLNNYCGMFLYFQLKYTLMLILDIICIRIYFNIYKFQTPYSTFRMYSYHLTFHLQCTKYMTMSILRKAENFYSFPNCVLYKCFISYETSLHTG